MARGKTWTAIACSHCDFSGGTRGMDRCSKCDGTGSQLLHTPSGQLYPNTEEGWKKLEQDHGPQSD